MDQTVRVALRTWDNDYSNIEIAYNRATGGQLVHDPITSPMSGRGEGKLSATIVVPAWNASDTIESCLTAIEQSSFNMRYQNRLQVVVIDDGSEDCTWEILQRLELDIELLCVRQAHYGRAQAMNTGINVAGGDIIISCDADLILSHYTIEELVKRHEVLNQIVLIGFRSDISGEDLSIRPAAIRDGVARAVPELAGDNRIVFDCPGWPRNMCVETSHLKRLGHGMRLWMPSGRMWDLCRMVYGALFSSLKKDLLLIDGYDESFRGWGWEDTFVGAKAVALGRYVIPVYAATGLHVAHQMRSPRQWQEAALNAVNYQNLLNYPASQLNKQSIKHAGNRIVNWFEKKISGRSLMKVPTTYKPPIMSEIELGDYYYSLGYYDRSATVFAQIGQQQENNETILFKLGRALSASGAYKSAVVVLSEALQGRGKSTSAFIELALVQAALEQFSEARQTLAQALEEYPHDRAARYWFHSPAYRHFRQGRYYAAHGYYQLAVRCFEAALMREPGHRGALRQRESCLRELDIGGDKLK